MTAPPPPDYDIASEGLQNEPFCIGVRDFGSKGFFMKSEGLLHDRKGSDNLKKRVFMH